MKNPKVQNALRIATIGGASILVITNALSLLKVKSAKEALMPALAILVGVAAFTHATASPSVVVTKQG